MTSDFDADGWCVECGDAFHLDDCGGYNPPCQTCGLCRSCCDCNGQHSTDDEYEGEYPSEGVLGAPGESA